jgi:hypothetical protein
VSVISICNSNWVANAVCITSQLVITYKTIKQVEVYTYISSCSPDNACVCNLVKLSQPESRAMMSWLKSICTYPVAVQTWDELTEAYKYISRARFFWNETRKYCQLDWPDRTIPATARGLPEAARGCQDGTDPLPAGEITFQASSNFDFLLTNIRL